MPTGLRGGRAVEQTMSDVPGVVPKRQRRGSVADARSWRKRWLPRTSGSVSDEAALRSLGHEGVRDGGLGVCGVLS